MTNVKYGLYIQNYAAKTINIKNSTITSIGIWARSGYSAVQTFNFEGANTVGTLTDSQYAKYVLTATDATLTAPEGYDVTTAVADSRVEYKDGKYSVVVLFSIYGANLDLGNSLDMNFFINPLDLASTIDKALQLANAGTWYVEIVKENGDKLIIEQDEWHYVKSKQLFYVTCSDVAAKEMTDIFTVQVFCSAGNIPVSAIWTDSVCMYAERLMNNDQANEKRTNLLIDMLNYGAAVQQQKTYKTLTLANQHLTSEQQNRYLNYELPAKVEISSDVYAGVTLELVSDMNMGFAFAKSALDSFDSYKITISHTRYHGKPEFEHTYAGFTEDDIKGDIYYVAYYPDIVVGDTKQEITITLEYTKDGITTTETIIDTVEQYVVRKGDTELPCGKPLLQFAESARAYLKKS